MELIIDIGNSCSKLAVFDNNKIIEVFYDSNRKFEKIESICSAYPISKGILSTVIETGCEIEEQINKLPFSVLKFASTTKTPIINDYNTPSTLGTDRIAAVVGAESIYPDKNLLVIDFGTCITYDFIDSERHYKGGNISPGLDIRLKSLNAYTGKLPLVKREGEKLLLGNNTETAIRSGVFLGIELEIKGFISLLLNKYPDLLVFLTGGDEFSFDTNLKNVIFADKFLVLKGLNRILHYNDKL